LSFLAEAGPELVKRLAALKFENSQAGKLSLPAFATEANSSPMVNASAYAGSSTISWT
jgi:hypothetical protein